MKGSRVLLALLCCLLAPGVTAMAQTSGDMRGVVTDETGGVVPGVLILAPDFPENKEDWPFLWGENEYVITVGGSYLFLANAADALVRRQDRELHAP